MNADDIKYFLRLKYSRTWAFYEELRPFTGFAGSVNQIDGLAVGLYEKNEKIITFEIKVDRGDFLQDVSRFMHKHRFALDISNEFYYVCPWNLIDKSEVPDISGLMYINKGHKIQVKKMAQVRVKKDISFHYLQALLQNSKRRINYTDIPVTYLGRNWTQKDFMEEIDKKVQGKIEGSFKYDVEKQVSKRLKEEDAYCLRFKSILQIAGIPWMYKDKPDEALERLKTMLENGKEVEAIRHKAEMVIKSLSQLRKEFQE